MYRFAISEKVKWKREGTSICGRIPGKRYVFWKVSTLYSLIYNSWDQKCKHTRKDFQKRNLSRLVQGKILMRIFQRAQRAQMKLGRTQT